MGERRWLVGLLGLILLASRGEAVETQIWDADSTIATVEEGRQIKEYFGLRLTSGDLSVTSAHALYRDWEEYLECEGGVTLRDTTRVVTAHRLSYSMREQRISASGKVEFEGRRYRLSAEEVSYEQRTRSFVAKESVVLEDREKHLVLTGDRMVYHEDQRTGVVRGRPKLTKEREGLSIEGEVLRVNDAVVVAEGGVRVVHREATGLGDTAVYEDTTKHLTIKGGSRLFWKREETERIEQGEISGREMMIVGNDTTLSEITSVGGTRLRWTTINRNDGGNYLSLLKSDSLHIAFQEGAKPRSLTAYGRATSLHLTDGREEPDRLKGEVISVDLGVEGRTVVTAEGNAEGIYSDQRQGRKKGSGRVRGERIRFVMEDQRMSRVEVDGGVAGVYKEEKDDEK